MTFGFRQLFPRVVLSQQIGDQLADLNERLSKVDHAHEAYLRTKKWPEV